MTDLYQWANLRVKLNDVVESYLSASERSRVTSPSNQSYLRLFRVVWSGAMNWSTRGTIEIQELLNRFEPLVCKFTSPSSRIKLNILRTSFQLQS